MTNVDTSALVPLFHSEPHSVGAAEWVRVAGSALRAGDALHLACAEAAGAKRRATRNDALTKCAGDCDVISVAWVDTGAPGKRKKP